MAVVPVLDLRKVRRVSLTERAVLVVEPQIARMPVARDKYVRPAIPVGIGNGRAERPVLRPADARRRCLVGDGHRDRGRRRGRVRRRVWRGAHARDGWHRGNGRRCPGGERDGSRGTVRLFDERVRALPAHQREARPCRVGRKADDLVAGHEVGEHRQRVPQHRLAVLVRHPGGRPPVEKKHR